MHLSRRGLLRAGLATTAAATLGGTTASCSVPSGSTGRDMTLWYWTASPTAPRNPPCTNTANSPRPCGCHASRTARCT
nr:twin-arginine translocation signal domain-containing protein [Streptomyces botrytidirepellens]